MPNSRAQTLYNVNALQTRQWAVWDNNVYDLSDYFSSIDPLQGSGPDSMFFNQSVTDLFKQQPGQDISKPMNKAMAALGKDLADRHYQCLRNNFYVGKKDPRELPRCLAPNYLLLSFSVILLITILAKCASISSITTVSSLIFPLFRSPCCATTDVEAYTRTPRQIRHLPGPMLYRRRRLSPAHH